MTFNLPRLVDLELFHVTFDSDESFHKLISRCPVLSLLKIHRKYANDLIICAISSHSLRVLEVFITDNSNYVENQQLKIDAPALEQLFLKLYKIYEISLTRLNSLIKVEFDLDCVFPDQFGWDYSPVKWCNSTVEKVIQAVNHAKSMKLKVIQAVNHAKLMKLSDATMVILCIATTKLSAPFDRLTELYLKVDSDHWGHLLDLLHCSTKLQVLRIKEISNGTEFECHWRDPQSVPECLKYTLLQVSLSLFYDMNMDEYELVSYILEHGSVLKELILKDPDLELEKKLLMRQKISMVLLLPVKS